MRIGELARAAGVSGRALRHDEERGLLTPRRLPNGYRDYAASDVARVARIRAMLSAGLPTATIRDALACAHGGESGVSDVALEMCPRLRDQLEVLEGRLEEAEEAARAARQRLEALTATSAPDLHETHAAPRVDRPAEAPAETS